MVGSELRTWTQAEIRELREQTLDDTGAREVGPPLSERQLQVLVLTAEGLTVERIGKRLFISQSTVKSHMKQLYAALGAHSAAQAVHLGYQAGLLTVGGDRG